MKRILIIGSGGSEHPIVWALKKTSQEPLEIFCAPGNAGIEQLALIANVPVNDHSALAGFVESQNIDLTFVGLVAPLVSRIVVAFPERGLRIGGPNARAA